MKLVKRLLLYAIYNVLNKTEWFFEWKTSRNKQKWVDESKWRIVSRINLVGPHSCDEEPDA